MNDSVLTVPCFCLTTTWAATIDYTKQTYHINVAGVMQMNRINCNGFHRGTGLATGGKTALKVIYLPGKHKFTEESELFQGQYRIKIYLDNSNYNEMIWFVRRIILLKFSNSNFGGRNTKGIIFGCTKRPFEIRSCQKYWHSIFFEGNWKPIFLSLVNVVWWFCKNVVCNNLQMKKGYHRFWINLRYVQGLNIHHDSK